MLKFLFPWNALRYGRFSLRYKLLLTLIFLTNLSAGVARADTTVIAMLGDSLTHGYGLPADEGLVGQLQTWVDAEGADIRLINAGVSGDTTAGGRARLDWTLTPEVNAVIVELGGNDMMRGLPPQDSLNNLTEILATLKARGLPTLLVGLPASSNFGAEYRSEFDAIYPDLAAQFDSKIYPDIFAAFRAELSDPTALTTYMQSDAIHPNAHGVALIVRDLGPIVLELAQQTQ
jgi:acyl-CoA thioesterase-1